MSKPSKTLEPPRRVYYSVRSGRRQQERGFSLADFKPIFLGALQSIQEEGLLQEWFGHYCVDAGDVSGRAGEDVDLFILRKLRRRGLWPIHTAIESYSEDDLFDMIEFLFDHSSAGVNGFHHSFNNCGWHYETFDSPSGRDSFRRQMNEILIDYGDGYELSENGEILTLPNEQFDSLLSAELPHEDKLNVVERVARAKLKYRMRAISDRRDAVRDLVDVLEFVRKEAKQVLNSKDEADLFNLANNFGIRHHRPDQKTDYDESIWLSWMFYHYLATIHACVRLIARDKQRLLDE